ncbi:response regulator [Pseudomonas sp.]|uniref:response regulator n=1 Tax=Pseudomonas sp. TaxID=306 RepID=UPI003D139DC1
MSTAMIVDDHPLIRLSLRLLLQRERYEVVAECGDGVEAVQLARQHRPNLILLDIGMPRLDGLGVISRVRQLGLPCKILVLTAHTAESYSVRCMTAGANGFFSKTDSLVELQRALRAVMSGFIHFPVLAARPAQGEASNSERALIEKLSNRELSILQHLARGYSNKEIGERLLLSNKTVSTYKMRLIDKLHMKSLITLAEFAKRNDLA